MSPPSLPQNMPHLLFPPWPALACLASPRETMRSLMRRPPPLLHHGACKYVAAASIRPEARRAACGLPVPLRAVRSDRRCCGSLWRRARPVCTTSITRRACQPASPWVKCKQLCFLFPLLGLIPLIIYPPRTCLPRPLPPLPSRAFCLLFPRRRAPPAEPCLAPSPCPALEELLYGNPPFLCLS